MITLQDAIERARLAADDDGMLANYTYDQIIQQLDETDKYAFTMALVDLGIHTKLGSLTTYLAMQKVIAKDFYEEDEDDDPEEDEDIADEFVKVSQAFRRQTPGGLWAPDSYFEYDDEPKKTQESPVDYTSVSDEEPYSDEDYETFLDSTPFSYFPGRDSYTPEEMIKALPEDEEEPGGGGGNGEPPGGPPDEPEFVEVSTEGLVESLESAGILIDSEDKVSLYKQNIPGLYTDRVFSPQPLDKTIRRLNNEADSIDKEQNRIESLQDLVTLIGQDVEAVDQGAKLKDFVPKFEEYAKKLEQFKYSKGSRNPQISSIAQDIEELKQYVQPSNKNVKQVKKDVLKLRKLVSGLKSQLDEYYQTQYENYDNKLEAIDALEKVQEVKESNPEQYQQIVREIGGITAKRLLAASFVEAQLHSYWDDYEEDVPEYGALDLEIGKDLLIDFLESQFPGQGAQVLEEYLKQGGLSHDSEESGDLRNDLEGELNIDSIEGVEDADAGVFFKLSEGSNLSGNRGRWEYEQPERDTGYPGGWVIYEYEPLTSKELQDVLEIIKEDLQMFFELYQKGEFN